MSSLATPKQDLNFPFVVPALVLMAFVTLVPLGFVLYFGLTRDGQFTVSGLTDTVTSALFFRVLANTIVISVTTALVATLLAYPVSLHIAAQPPRLRNLYVMIIMLPFWTSILVKSFSFVVLLGRYGLINNSLRDVFGEDVFFPLLYNRFGVIIGWSVKFFHLLLCHCSQIFCRKIPTLLKLHVPWGQVLLIFCSE